MSEKLLFEIPEVRITTRQIVFNDATFEIGYIASTEIDDRITRLGSCIFWASLALIVCAGGILARFVGWAAVAIVIILVLLPILDRFLPSPSSAVGGTRFLFFRAPMSKVYI